MRFLRRRYQDPITRGEFRLLHLGEVQFALRPRPATASGSADSFTSGSTQTSGEPTLLSVSQMGGQGPTFGGGPIIGVSSTSDKASYHVFFNNADHYKDWVFAYSPVLDRGGLFTRPYDGIPTFSNGNQPPPPGTPPSAPPGQQTAPGVTIPQSSGAGTQ